MMLGELLTEAGIDIEREITNSSFRRQALFAHGRKYRRGHVCCRPHPAPLPDGEGTLSGCLTWRLCPPQGRAGWGARRTERRSLHWRLTSLAGISIVRRNFHTPHTGAYTEGEVS